MELDLAFVRSQFPALDRPINAGQSFCENAGGSFACRQTIDALTEYYTDFKVQPYAGYESSATAGVLMDRSRTRWAEALGVAPTEVVFGPSTSANTYVLAHAFGELLAPGAEVIVTDQDHEANTGVFRRMAERTGATVREWHIDPTTGALDVAEFESLLTERTALVTVPHASNIVGQENDIARIVRAAHRVGARVVVDGVSFAPHTLPDVGRLGADVYLFSLYKTYSVHQGLMVVRSGLMTELPNQGHFFNEHLPDKRLNPAGPDHAQVAAAGAVLDYVEAFDRHHRPASDIHPASDVDLRTAVEHTSAAWRAHENVLSSRLLGGLADRDDLRIVGPTLAEGAAHRCPTIALDPLAVEPFDLARSLVERGVQTASGHFYAVRALRALGIDPERGVVRLSFVHYTTRADVDRTAEALDDALG